ncbi:hypothetical protein J3B02_005759 [Coemansia erecta]|nr:hypothetical protein J3B02_005759 [Coemansia erecta]
MFKSESKKDDSESAMVRLASNVSRKVCACLLQAEASGVYHRDISAGNIMVNDRDEVFLIDWGFGKVLRTLSLSAKTAVKNDWDIDLDELTRNEDARDGMTGTIYYMGIRVLLGQTNRSIFDDLESLLYVILGGFSHLYTEKFAADAPGFEIASNKKSAFAKVGIMLDSENYPKSFGVKSRIPEMYAVLNRLYKLVFEQKGNFAGALLLDDEPERRVLDHQLLKEILDDSLYIRCFPQQQQQQQQQQPTSAKKISTNTQVVQEQAEAEEVMETKLDPSLTTQMTVLVPMPITEPIAIPVPVSTLLQMPAVTSAFTIHCPIPSSRGGRITKASDGKGLSPISPTPLSKRNASSLALEMVQLNVSSSFAQNTDSRKRKTSRDEDIDDDHRASKSKRTDSNLSREENQENQEPTNYVPK